jgi:NADH:ubiquinone oxidoreductase subunit 4 (subunit M)
MTSLALTTLLPLVGAVLALLLPSSNQRLFRGYGIAVALATFLQSLFVLAALNQARVASNLKPTGRGCRHSASVFTSASTAFRCGW